MPECERIHGGFRADLRVGSVLRIEGLRPWARNRRLGTIAA
jgi:hypothetical protein